MYNAKLQQRILLRNVRVQRPPNSNSTRIVHKILTAPRISVLISRKAKQWSQNASNPWNSIPHATVNSLRNQSINPWARLHPPHLDVEAGRRIGRGGGGPGGREAQRGRAGAVGDEAGTDAERPAVGADHGERPRRRKLHHRPRHLGRRRPGRPLLRLHGRRGRGRGRRRRSHGPRGPAPPGGERREAQGGGVGGEEDGRRWERGGEEGGGRRRHGVVVMERKWRLGGWGGGEASLGDRRVAIFVVKCYLDDSDLWLIGSCYY